MFGARAVIAQCSSPEGIVAMHEYLRDKEDDDWSRWFFFEVKFHRGILGDGFWEVVANSIERVGTYPDYAAASQAKLEYRRLAPACYGLIGLEGLG